LGIRKDNTRINLEINEIYLKYHMILVKAGWQTGNGVNCCWFGGAFKTSVAGGQTSSSCHFRPPFLWFISFGGAKEMNKILWASKK
jgi:hypothetical protein